MGDLLEELVFDKPLSFSDEGGHGTANQLTYQNVPHQKSRASRKGDDDKKKQGWTNYQTWVNAGINLKFKMPDNLTKYFTDFSKVTIESEKDLPIFLLNQIYEIQFA